MTKLLGLIMLLWVGVAGAAAPAPLADGGGIVYGSGLGVGIAAPDGWSFDSHSGAAQGLHAVFYPHGSSWAKAAAVMYLNLAELETGESLAGFIAGDVARFRQRSPSLRVETAAPLRLRDGQSAQVRHFSDPAGGTFEAIAYARHRSAVAVFALSCRDPESFEANLPAFATLVQSSFVTKSSLEKPAAPPPPPAPSGN